jgi:hypothetical protein
MFVESPIYVPLSSRCCLLQGPFWSFSGSEETCHCFCCAARERTYTSRFPSPPNIFWRLCTPRLGDARLDERDPRLLWTLDFWDSSPICCCASPLPHRERFLIQEAPHWHDPVMWNVGASHCCASDEPSIKVSNLARN